MKNKIQTKLIKSFNALLTTPAQAIETTTYYHHDGLQPNGVTTQWGQTLRDPHEIRLIHRDIEVP